MLLVLAASNVGLAIIEAVEHVNDESQKLYSVTRAKGDSEALPAERDRN